MDAGSLDPGSVTSGGGVIDGHGEPLDPAQHGADGADDQQRGDGPGLLARRGDGDVAGSELIGEPDGANPGGDGASAAGEDGPDEQEDEPGGGPAIEGRGQASKPLARVGEFVGE